MIDLHNHLLPGLDDGAVDLAMALAMARAFVADGVEVVACTPHILPGLYHNSGPSICAAVAQLQAALDVEQIPLQLVAGADNHIVPDFVGGLRSGHLLSLAGSRYVLVEPPHHSAPARLDEFFFNILVAGYVPILTHPERLMWIRTSHALIEKLAANGVWMQITSGSLNGAFGRDARYWAERLLDEGCAHILASDSHDLQRRPPDLRRGFECAARRVGESEATHLVVTRPAAVLANKSPCEVPRPAGGNRSENHVRPWSATTRTFPRHAGQRANLTDRLRHLFK